MANKSNPKKLGRGLDTLLGNSVAEVKEALKTEVQKSLVFENLEISQIHPNPDQPRKNFDQEALEELAESIRTNGIITPITVCKDATRGGYMIIAGERRYRAAQMAALTKMPAYIREVEDEKVLEMALVENIQREDLNAIEIALTYSNMAQMYNLSQEELAQRVGKKRATVTNYMRLLELPAEIQMGLRDHKIEMGHARAIAGLSSAEKQLSVYNKVVTEGASVRRTEQLCREVDNPKQKNDKKSAETEAIEESLRLIFGCDVKVSYTDKGSGEIKIKYRNDSEFEKLLSTIEKLKVE